MTIRELCPDDIPAVISLWEAADLPFRPDGRDRAERIVREIAGPSSVFLVAEDDGGLVGVVFGTHDGRKGWINRLAVAPGEQRRGIASALEHDTDGLALTHFLK